MKKISISLLLLLYMLQSLTLSAGQWFVVDQPPYSAHFRSIDCFDSLHCVAVGTWNLTNTVARITTDGGITWFDTLNDSTKIIKGKDTIFPTKPFEVICKKPNLVIISCTSGSFWHSTDRGLTWEKSIIPERENPNGISMFNDRFGAVAFYPFLYLTTNGGSSWYKQEIVVSDTNFQPKGLEFISVPDSTTIILNVWKSGDEGYTIFSYDRGKTWNYNSPPKLRLGYIKFLDKKTGWAVGRYKKAPMRYADAVFKTTDGGKSWINQLDSLTPKTGMGLIKLKFWNYNIGIAYGPFGHLWKTTNGGKLWFRDPDYQYGNNTSAEFDDFAFLDSTTLLAIDSWRHRIFKYTKDTILSYISLELDDKVFLYPNPATDYIEIAVDNHILQGMDETNRTLKDAVKVYDVFGVCVATHPLAPSREGVAIRLDVSGLPAGVYFVRIGSKMYKFVKI